MLKSNSFSVILLNLLMFSPLKPLRIHRILIYQANDLISAKFPVNFLPAKITTSAISQLFVKEYRQFSLRTDEMIIFKEIRFSFL